VDVDIVQIGNGVPGVFVASTEVGVAVEGPGVTVPQALRYLSVSVRKTGVPGKWKKPTVHRSAFGSAAIAFSSGQQVWLLGWGWGMKPQAVPSHCEMRVLFRLPSK
jgi:hypothetical protein